MITDIILIHLIDTVSFIQFITGVFPDNFVELMPLQSSAESSPRLPVVGGVSPAVPSPVANAGAKDVTPDRGNHVRS